MASGVNYDMTQGSTLQRTIFGFLFVLRFLFANVAMADPLPEYAEHLDLTYVLSQSIY